VYWLLVEGTPWIRYLVVDRWFTVCRIPVRLPICSVLTMEAVCFKVAQICYLTSLVTTATVIILMEGTKTWFLPPPNKICPCSLWQMGWTTKCLHHWYSNCSSKGRIHRVWFNHPLLGCRMVAEILRIIIPVDPIWIKDLPRKVKLTCWQTSSWISSSSSSHNKPLKATTNQPLSLHSSVLT
jgi:hypothetical protein